MQPGSVQSREVVRPPRAGAARDSPGQAGPLPERSPSRRRLPSRPARLSITLGTTALVLLGAALTPVAERVAATATDPVTGAVVGLAGVGDGPAPEAASPPGPAAAAPQAEAVPGSPVVRREPVPEPLSTPVSREGTGELAVVPGVDAPPGDGPLRRYVVEVEQGLGVDAGEFARTVHATLNDPRSWAAAGAAAFERVDAGQARRASFRVALTSPDTTDRLCAPLDTNGELSCHSGGRAVLNVVRWLDGVDEHPDLTVYRQYLVNHEVGHALGHGHEPCPGAGRPAPVMQQQSKQVAPCLPNAWPHPLH